jgi:hypothetical protein
MGGGAAGNALIHARFAAGYVFHIFDRDRAKAQNQAV